MEAIRGNTKPVVGFLTVVEHPQHGLFGGYLIINLAGRPVEFHCTAPVKANRAQQILYGPTLNAFLYGEQIGATLLAHAKATPLAICTDQEPALSLADVTDLPVALVLPRDQTVMADGGAGEGAEKVVRLDDAHRGGPRLLSFELGHNRLALAKSSEESRRRLAEGLGPAAESLDLWEPFSRIREAIEEAQQAAR